MLFMRPAVIIHNSISLDTAYVGFDVDLGIHYGTLLSFEPDALLVGSATALSGIELGGEMPSEAEYDMKRPEMQEDDPRPVGVFVDSMGLLIKRLHFYRRLEHIKDVIVMVSENSPEEYLAYLEEREYPYIRAGTTRVNIGEALAELSGRFGISKVISDSGGHLNSHLIEDGIADELSLLTFPVLAGGEYPKLFEQLEQHVTLECISSSLLEGGVLHSRYRLHRD